jgi:hypothetical protein
VSRHISLKLHGVIEKCALEIKGIYLTALGPVIRTQVIPGNKLEFSKYCDSWRNQKEG